MNNVNPLKPFREFLPNAPKWLRVTLYTMRVILFMLPAIGTPTLVSCIGSTTNISTNIDGVGVGVAPDNSGTINLPADIGLCEEANEQNASVSLDEDESVSYHQIY